MNRFCRRLALCLAVCLLPLVSARAEGLGVDLPEPPEGAVTAQCSFTLPEGFEDGAARLTDGLAGTYTVLKNGDAMTVSLPDGVTGFSIGWHKMPQEAVIELLDATGTAIATLETQPYLNAYYPLDTPAAAVRISGTGLNSKPKKTGFFQSRYVSYMQISEFQAFAAEPPETVQRWEAAPGNPDLLFFASTPEAAARDFFAPIAYYAVEHETPCALIVLSMEDRAQVESLLSALWSMGVRQYPILCDYSCDNNESYNLVASKWGKKIVKAELNTLLSTYAPQVVVTHAADGSALDAAAQFTSEYVVAAAEAAGVKKVYTASADGGTALDFSAALVYSGMNAAETARTAYEDHYYESRAEHVTIAPVSAFNLVRTTVGGDVSSLLDNITPQNYVEPTAAPTAEPEITPSPAPTAAPEQPTAAPEQPAAAPAAFAERAVGMAGTLVPIVVAVIGLLISLVVFLTYSLKKLRKRRKKTRRKGVIAAIIPFAVGLLLAGGAWFLLKDVRAAAENVPAAEAPAPTETLPEETLPPEETPAEEALAEDAAQEDDFPGAESDESEDAAAAGEERAASENDSYFRQEGDPEEVIVVDEENGRWEYRTDTLSILIERHTGVYTRDNGQEANLVSFVAHIRMREINAFRTAQADLKRNGAGAVMPWIMARRANAVLMVTGDNLIESDEQYKSVLIRDGIVFQDSHKCDVLAMYPDATMKIFSPADTSADALLMDGVRDAFSFGPSFIIDGELQTGLDVNRLALDNNPRTGVGLVEPGHYVAIVVDGRRPEYSYGMSLSNFAKLFVDEGCTQAYNLDGGVSTCMLFMGEQLNHHGNQYNKNKDDTYQRRIPDGLVWGWSDQVPSEDDPIYNDGKD